MARRRARTTHCPACDEPLAAELADTSSPTCPRCDAMLLPVRAAATWRRCAAAIVDLAVLLATAGALNLLLLQFSDGPALIAEAKGIDQLLRVLELEPADVVRPLAPFIGMSALYLALFWTLTGRTVGGRLLGVRVVDGSGAPPKPAWAALRVVGHLLGLALGALGWLWALLDPDSRAAHDHLARTYVVSDA